MDNKNISNMLLIIEQLSSEELDFLKTYIVSEIYLREITRKANKNGNNTNNS